MMQGKLIVLEGIDGSGKSTQYQKLCQRLESDGTAFRKLVFPRYDKDSSALIRAYLGGEFGTRPSDVNAYAASTFFAVDRYASYMTEWRDYYEAGGLLLCDRYTTSNACHQGSKLSGEERRRFFDWLYEFEFGLLGLPRPSLVVYLDTEPDVSRRALRRREEATHTRADIHEQDLQYLSDSLSAGREAAERYGWQQVRCAANGEMRPVEDIHEEIYAAVSALLKR